VIIEAPDGRFLVYRTPAPRSHAEAGADGAHGEQLGLNGSSGNSSWPHLHLTELAGQSPRDPFAGPCRGGESDFATQPAPFRDAPYVRNLVVSPKPFRGEA
jgi:hypothetical protein